MTENFALYLGGQVDAGSVERCWVFGVGSNHGSIKRFIIDTPPGSGCDGVLGEDMEKCGRLMSQ